MGDEWVEEGSASEGITFRFDASDEVTGDGLTPSARDNAAWMSWLERVRDRVRDRSEAPRSVAVVFIAAWLALFSLGYPPLLYVGGAVLIGAALRWGLLLVSARTHVDRPEVVTTPEEFTLRLSADELRCWGNRAPAQSIDVSTIVRFVGEEGLRACLVDGTTISLPWPGRESRELADTLNLRLAEIRATLGGYRGEPVRVELDERPEDDENDHDDGQMKERA